MREVEHLDPMDYIGHKVYGFFDVFRNSDRFDFVNEQLPIVFLFLSLHKDGLIKQGDLKDQETFKKFRSELELRLKQGRKTYISVINALEKILDSLDRDLLKQISFKLFNFTGIDRKLLSDQFQEAFDSILFQIARSEGRFAGEIIQPLELTRLMCNLADLKNDAKVFNPFAGLASFGVYLTNSSEYFGQELNKNAWALGALRLMAFNKPNISRYVYDDSISNWPDDSQKFDLIISNPPYGMRISQQYREIEPGIRTVEQFLIEKGVNSLKSQGKLIALLPQGFLFRGMYEQRLRERLIEDDLIDTILSLPGGLLLNAGIPLVVLVIDKDKKLPGKVRFIDATKFVDAKNSREKVLNDYRLNSLIHKGYQDSEVVRIIDNNQIREFDYNLNVPRYFQKHIEGTRLKDIVEFVRGSRRDIPDEGKMIRIRDLKDDKLDFQLDVSSVDETEFSRPHLRSIDESCLLLATRWKTLKPTFFEFSGVPIFLNPDILSFRINEQVADTAYLINELHADYVEEQLASYRQGVTIPVISRDDLLEIVIKLPSLEEQRAKVQGILEISEKIKEVQKERNALAHGKAASQFNEFASLKHTLGRPRQNILDWTDNLLHFLRDKPEGFDSLNKAFLEFYKIDILSVLQEIKRDVNFMTEVLEKGENGFIVEEYDKTLIPLSDVNSLINELSSNGFKFIIKKLLLRGEKQKERGILGNITLFKTLVDNLLTNANKYGFDKKSTGNEVIFELMEIDDYLSVEVRNNGKPFPKNFDREKFITKYSTANSDSGKGLGGYDIHRIASEFNNPDWELMLNTDPIYPVKFKFQFQIKLIS